jgi:hypothetical protein
MVALICSQCVVVAQVYLESKCLAFCRLVILSSKLEVTKVGRSTCSPRSNPRRLREF